MRIQRNCAVCVAPYSEYIMPLRKVRLCPKCAKKVDKLGIARDDAEEIEKALGFIPTPKCWKNIDI